MQTLSAGAVLLLLPRTGLTAALDPVGETSGGHRPSPRLSSGLARTSPFASAVEATRRGHGSHGCMERQPEDRAGDPTPLHRVRRSAERQSSKGLARAPL